MNIISDIREKKGLSQRRFAKKASLSFRGLQLLEEKEHNWRFSTIRKVASALNLPESGQDLIIRNFLEQDRNSVMMVSIRIQTDGFTSWPLHLFNLVDAFRSSPGESLVHLPPMDGLDDKLKGLLASTVESLCADSKVNIPEWCYGVRALKDPWFVAEVESLKAMALVESPVRFRKRNIFVLGNFLDRA